MEKIRLSKGFKPLLAGTPDLSMINLREPATLGVSASDIPHIRPKLLVRENDPVKTGTPLFCDKRDKSILYVSPGTGVVEKILFGERRRLLEVVIRLDKETSLIQETDQGSILFPPVSSPADLPRESLVERLKQGGLWQSLRQFPAMDTADPGHKPAMIIVSLNGNDLFSPHPALVLKGERKAFETGLEVLKRFSSRIIVTARKSCIKKLGQDKDLVTHQVEDTFPAWDPGVVLYQLKTRVEENTSWCISGEHLIMVGKFLMTGRYPTKKIVSITESGNRRPHMLTRQGVPIASLAGSFSEKVLITTGQFNGRVKQRDCHLGFFENTLNLIPPGNGDEMFGFMRPGADKTSVSSTFLSSLFKGPKQLDCTLHGEVRACINCSYCQNICPTDLMPNFILKALHSDEIEEALELGLLDCTACGLCAYTCPSKIELTKILSDAMDSLHKDKA